MRVGDSVAIDDYLFRLEEIQPLRGPNYQSDMALVSIYRHGQPIATLRPEKRRYFVQTMPMTEAAIDTTLWRDLYVALAEQRGTDAWGLRVYHKPFQAWIWLGPALMALGGIFAVSDRRYRTAAKRVVAARRRLSARLRAHGGKGMSWRYFLPGIIFFADGGGVCPAALSNQSRAQYPRGAIAIDWQGSAAL